ncbi:endonuclease 8-like 3 [Liolophura sinensis]|uniref:endonuclease 8-like 3 n=1 Tax=Liolophura sinensis TaxID=3198878 RepID=UPI0031590B7A
MVEGPGCKLNGEKIRSKVSGQSVVKVCFGAGQKTMAKQAKEASACGKTEENQKFHELLGQRLEEVQTLGKELFMYFGREVCLRVHFGMNGSVQMNKKQTDSESISKRSVTPSLVLQMSKDSLAFFESSVDIRSASLCRAKYEELKSLDICSPVFSHKRALEVIQSQGTSKSLCDVLLDQSILPGVGNIIKNEALFDSGLKPDTKACELKEEHLTHLIKMTRDFSMLFYECRKSGQTLSKYYKVYGQETCGQCKTRLVICRMGEVTARLTYFCPTCQTNDLSISKHRLPKKNSLLGWLGKASQTSPSHWNCLRCTLINQGSQKSCSACLTPRDLGQEPGPNSKTQGTPGRQVTTPHPSQYSNISIHNTSHKRKSDSAGFLAQPSTQPSKRRRSEGNCGKENVSSAPVRPADNKHKITACTGHGKKCLIKEVRKEGPNYKRTFFTCSLPRGKAVSSILSGQMSRFRYVRVTESQGL